LRCSSYINKISSAIALRSPSIGYWLYKNKISYTQVGFQFARSTLDAVYALILAISIRRLYGMPTYLAFIGVKKAFPSAFKAGILVKLYRLGITGKCWCMLRSMYSSTVHSRILTGQESCFSEEELEALYYKIETGLR
jgi:hypothetical protein